MKDAIIIVAAILLIWIVIDRSTPKTEKPKPQRVEQAGGCDIYRVTVDGRTIYTTICPDHNETDWEEYKGIPGKGGHSEPQKVETVRRPAVNEA